MTDDKRSMTKAIVVFDIDGVVRDVGGSYRRAIADTVEHFTNGAVRPSSEELDQLKSEGIWNNDWQASQELVYRYFEGQGQARSHLNLDYDRLVAFFQSRYQGSDPENWTGYICTEPLLLQPGYLQQLSTAGIVWGFFSGAPRAEAAYLLTRRLGIQSPVLVGMEDAPGKPDPTGLFAAVFQLEKLHQIDTSTPVIYVGDTVADLWTVEKARTLGHALSVSLAPQRHWIAVGILPPHVQETSERRDAYRATLLAAGADAIFSNVQELTSAKVEELVGD